MSSHVAIDAERLLTFIASVVCNQKMNIRGTGIKVNKLSGLTFGLGVTGLVLWRLLSVDSINAKTRHHTYHEECTRTIEHLPACRTAVDFREHLFDWQRAGFWSTKRGSDG